MLPADVAGGENMGWPDAVGQVRDAPFKALRTVFAGVGQLLLAADKLREEEADGAAEPDGRDDLLAADAEPRQQARGTRAGRKPAAADAKGEAMRAGRASRSGQTEDRRRFRSLDATGNVRLLTSKDIAEMSDAELLAVGLASGEAPSPEREPAPEPETPAPPTRTTTARRRKPAALPVAGYDDLSVASLRARLRNLDVSQLRVLADYEKSHARRADVVAMFERRIDKLEAAASDAT
jgi:hypothetical protein